MRTFAAGSGGAGAGGAGAGGAGSGAGSGGMPAAGTGALAGAGAGGGGGSGGGSCFEWKTVADLLHTPEDPTDGSWPAGEETLQSPGKSVQQYICLGAPGASPPSVGKAVYTYGCYVPRGDKPFKDTTDIQILVSRNPTCLDWAPLLNGQLPANVQRLGTPSDSVPVCHAAHTGMTPEGLMSTGVHVGEAVPIGNSFNCRFEFYDTLLTVADFEVLVRKSP
jgi:hypothetical protein